MPVNSTPLQTSLGVAPKEGPMTIPLTLDFTAGQTYTFDATAQQMNGQRISVFQSIFVDNSLATVPLSIAVANTQQVIKIPGGSQAYIPIACTSKLSVTFASSSGLVLYAAILNIPMNGIVWNSSGSFTFDANGNLLVRDTVLDSTVSGGFIRASEYGLAGDGTQIQRYYGTKRFYGTFATGNLNAFVGAPGFMITDVAVYLTPDATLATAGTTTVFLKEASTNIAQGTAFVPTTAVTGLTGPIPLIARTGLNYTSKASASQVALSISTALATGSIVVEIGYALTNFVGG